MKIWFITGASRGFGREWAKAALARGDKVAATARDTETLEDLMREHGKNILPIRLDVADREADLAAEGSEEVRFHLRPGLLFRDFFDRSNSP